MARRAVPAVGRTRSAPLRARREPAVSHRRRRRGGGSGSGSGGAARRRVAEREVARHEVARSDLAHLGLVRRAALLGVRAAGAEPAARRWRQGRRDLAADALACHHGGLRIGLRDRAEERSGVRVRGCGVQLVGLRELAQLAEVHHRDPVAHVLDDGEVVGDEDERQPVLLLHLLEQVEDLGLHGDVEGGHRLVADDQLRLGGHRTRDRDALALAAGELVRPLRARDRRVDADGVEHLVDACVPRRLVADLPDVEPLAHDVADAPARVQRRDRVLEDHLELRAERAEELAPEVREVVALEDDRVHSSGGRAA